jgi:hypothetical protein
MYIVHTRARVAVDAPLDQPVLFFRPDSPDNVFKIDASGLWCSSVACCRGGFAGVTNSHSDVAGDVAGNVGSRDSTFVVYLRINGIAGRTFKARDIIRCPGKH